MVGRERHSTCLQSVRRRIWSRRRHRRWHRHPWRERRSRRYRAARSARRSGISRRSRPARRPGTSRTFRWARRLLARIRDRQRRRTPRARGGGLGRRHGAEAARVPGRSSCAGGDVVLEQRRHRRPYLADPGQNEQDVRIRVGGQPGRWRERQYVDGRGQFPERRHRMGDLVRFPPDRLPPVHR